MPKKKISRKRAESSRGKRTSRRYKPGSETSVSGLREAITEALFEADFDTFRGCIAILLEKNDYQEITRETGLSKSTLYRMSEPGSNPTLENIGKLLSYISSLEELEAA